jgi:anti-sigma regulatory factor (Ser/Thr protein kinase)
MLTIRTMNNKSQKKSEEIRQFILDNVEDHPGDITIFTADQFGISRQAVHRHVTFLLSAGLLLASGVTRNSMYTPKPIADFSIQLPLHGLAEDRVWRIHILPLMENVPVNVVGICQYGFTEMVNNVIDHSEGSKLTIQVKRTYKFIELWIMDDGIGIFTKIQNELHLDDALHAILELSKGKLTTDALHHTGEGVFFTSRMFDEFALSSGKLFFAHRYNKDWLLENTLTIYNGTCVRLRISPKSTRTAQQVFNQYTTGEDHSFSKTNVPVFLATYGDENLISRSQARRLLMRFERFKEIILDFNKVDSIGQAFADEIFRVFSTEHPGIHLTTINTKEQILKMISRVTSEV